MTILLFIFLHHKPHGVILINFQRHFADIDGRDGHLMPTVINTFNCTAVYHELLNGRQIGGGSE